MPAMRQLRLFEGHQSLADNTPTHNAGFATAQTSGCATRIVRAGAGLVAGHAATHTVSADFAIPSATHRPAVRPSTHDRRSGHAPVSNLPTLRFHAALARLSAGLVICALAVLALAAALVHLPASDPAVMLAGVHAALWLAWVVFDFATGPQRVARDHQRRRQDARASIVAVHAM